MPRKKPAKKTNKRIFFTREITNFHLLQKQKPTDEYFRGIADKVYEAIETEGAMGLPITDAQRRSIALRMTMYLEDLVTETGTWLAFLSMCKKRYGTPIPMVREIIDIINEEGVIPDFEEELKYYPTLPAVQFLLWLWIGECMENMVLNPGNPALSLISIKLVEILQDGYDEAPDLVLGRVAFVDEKISKIPNYIQVRQQCQWLLETNWLTRCSNLDGLFEDLKEELKELMPDPEDRPDIYSYACESYLPLNTQTGPIAAYPQEWLREMVNLVHQESENFILPYLDNLESKPFSGYLYKSISEDRRSAVIECADGKEYQFSAYTMPNEKITPEIKSNTMSLMSIIKWGDKWCLNSVSNSGISAKMFENLKNDLSEKNQQQEHSYQFALKTLKGKRIGVAKNIDEVAKIFRDAGVNPPTGEDTPVDYQTANNIVWFLCKDGNLEFYPNIAGLIKLRGNKYYDKEQARNQGIGLVMATNSFPDELRKYIVENNLIPDAALNNPLNPELGHKIFQDNIEFLLDYSCRDMFDMYLDIN